MITKILLLVGMLVMTVTGTSHAADLVLLNLGNSDYQIIVPDESPSPAIRESLNQIARLVQTAFKANGGDVPVVTESKRDPAKPGIYLGNTAFAQTHGVDFAHLKGWSYVHKVIARDVIVAGNDQPSPGKVANPGAPAFDRLGTAKAATDFVRRYAGARFLYPDVTPRAALSEVGTIDLLNSPAIEFLRTPTISIPSDLDVQETALLTFNTTWAQSAGFYDLANNRFPPVNEVFGGHTYARAVPPEKYRETHPEYFALINGKRLADGPGQYCISNPDVQELIYQDLIGWLDNGYATVDLGQPDGFQPCQCDQCKKLFDTGDDWSEKLWIFHRHLAERVLAARPGKQVTLMSYILTALPPKSFKKFPANVRIMLTGTNEDDLQPWRDCDVPGGFTAYLYNWCPNLGTRYTPMRTPRYVETQAQRLIRNHFQAIYRDGAGGLYGLEGPVYYVMGRMYDDGGRNTAKDLLPEFCDAAFGKAAPPMQRFYDQLYDAIELYSEYLGTRDPAWTYQDIYGRGHKYLTDPFQLLGFLYPPRLLESLEKELTEAEQTANSSKAKVRLALVRREFDYVKDLMRVIHLAHAYEIQPDIPSRDRLLDAIDARNARIDSYYDPAKNKEIMAAGWAYVLFPIPGHTANHLRLAYDGYQEPFKNTCVNWDTTLMRQMSRPEKRPVVTPDTFPLLPDKP